MSDDNTPPPDGPGEPIPVPETPPPTDTPADPNPGPTNTDPPIEPAQPVTFQPALWYSATATCHTTTCPNYNQIMNVPMLYSNAGYNATIICGLCGQKAIILTAQLLDPQPEES